MSEQEALKEAEIKLREKLSGTQNLRFGEYKKIMKNLFDRMFDNQTKMLKKKVDK